MRSPSEICINLKLAWSYNELLIINCTCCCCIQPTPDRSMLRFKPCSGVFTHVTSSVYQSQHGLVHVNKIRTLWWRSAVMSLNANFRPPETALSARSSAAGVCAPPTWRSCANSDLPTSKNYFGKHYRPPKLQTTLPTCSDDVHMRQTKNNFGKHYRPPKLQTTLLPCSDDVHMRIMQDNARM